MRSIEGVACLRSKEAMQMLRPWTEQMLERVRLTEQQRAAGHMQKTKMNMVQETKECLVSLIMYRVKVQMANRIHFKFRKPLNCQTSESAPRS